MTVLEILGKIKELTAVTGDDFTYITLFDDGSGDVIYTSEEGSNKILFGFSSLEDFAEKAEEKLNAYQGN